MPSEVIMMELRMKCPVDNEILVMTQRSGVEIDYCPKCRGVWLDRGELDKIVDRASTEVGSSAAYASPPPQSITPSERPFREQDRNRGEQNSYGQGYGQKPYKKKREGFLSDLFDF